MPNLTWWQAASIGAIGGLALGLLKLIDAKFFLTGSSSVEAYASYLTYFCYVVLGSVAAVFLADHELPPAKTRRSAFILGLLAPSVLLAIANQPAKPTDAAKIPALSSFFINEALAQATGPQRADASSAPKVELLRASTLQPSFTSALAAAVGRGEIKEPYAYVVGSTPDKAKALETARMVQSVLDESHVDAPQPKVIQVEGGTGYYVLVGDLGSKDQLRELRLQTTSSAIKSIDTTATKGSASLADRKSVASLLVNAAVVPANSLGAVGK